MTNQPQPESDADKLRKRQDKERRKEFEIARKKLIKTLVKEQKSKDKDKNQDPLQKSKPQDADKFKQTRPQDAKKREDKKLKEASKDRRDALKNKPKRTLSQKDKTTNKAVQDDKKARLADHLKEKAASRASLDRQKASLKAEVKALNKLSDVRETVDGEYTAKFSGFQSAIAAGPMGAASTGLRKLDPSVWINMKRAEAGAKVQNKIDPKVAQQLQKIKRVAKDLKLSDFKELRWAQSTKVKATREALASEQKVEHSKLRSKIKEMKTKEKMRDPNRDPSKVDELNMPFRGVGGTGGV